MFYSPGVNLEAQAFKKLHGWRQQGLKLEAQCSVQLFLRCDSQSRQVHLPAVGLS